MIVEGEIKGSLDRGIAILDYLAKGREATTAQLAAAGNMSRSATYRLVERLRTLGYLESAGAGRWKLGAGAARLATTAARTADIVQVGPELLHLLAQQSRETVGLAVPRGDEMVFVYRELGPKAVNASVELGGRRPMHASAVGKAYLAALPDGDRARLSQDAQLESCTPYTVTDRARLEAEIELTRVRGWAEERSEFNVTSACCGAAVLDCNARPVGAISVAGGKRRVELAMSRLGPLVAATAEAISCRLGWDPSTVHPG
ncbi:IclR family transcriptional regulator [Nocardia jinanensis]|uniref:IclR family transcriptional regulator n=1 Tax=Nocardia jinanensis TaxID=382504 RepID=A0A917RKM4_9NOCA|nr:IclR family transcriptional regulator [Nocardia jinanensis]GGL10814.1 IclR family transcriptional regulator [Nocardia jinanensis]